MEQLRPKTYIDFVICLDASMGMISAMDEVKKHLVRVFYSTFVDKFEEEGKEIGQFRIKLIVFRSLESCGVVLEESPFFLLPDQIDELSDLIKGIEVKGNPDPGAGVAAITRALHADWTTGGEKRRHFIALLTNASLSEGADAEVRNKLFEDIRRFGAYWEDLGSGLDGGFQPRAGRLLLFVPAAEPWVIFQVFNRCFPAFLDWTKVEGFFDDWDWF